MTIAAQAQDQSKTWSKNPAKCTIENHIVTIEVHY